MAYNNQNYRNGPGPIPKRWLHCPRKSDGIIAERFIAFKTPLSSAFNEKVPAACRFTPDMIMGYCSSLKMKLGLWIDLTNTNRFYDRKGVENRGITYIKLQCRGHGETPSIEQTRSFIEIVDNFINDRPLDLIGVHCTHGFNRTGFLIISYLVERLDCSLEGALAMFGQARSPGIYKQDYINELYRRYENEEDALPAPEMPDWCFEEEEEEDNVEEPERILKRPHETNESDEEAQAEQNETDGPAEGASENGNNASGKKKKRRRETIVENAKFMDEVPNVFLVKEEPLLGSLQLECQEMCGWQKSGFPGAQPVSLNPHNLQRLRQIPYRVSWKADGTRYMMLIKDRDQIYFFDRNHSCFEVKNLTFVRPDNLREHLKNTLVDGEMVLDKFEGKTIPRYLIYDVIKYEGRDVGKEPFYPTRLDCIKRNIIQPRRDAMMKRIINREVEPFGVRDKEFWNINEAQALLSEKFARSLSHEPDGLIFQPSEQPYKTGVCDDVFKWKPSNMNSIDFRLRIIYETGQGILKKKIGVLFVGCAEERPFGKIRYTKNLKDYDNKIVECYLDPQGEWQFMRERTDKQMPNSMKTAEAVLDSIKNPVTKEMLLSFIARYNQPNLMAPPSSNHVHRSLSQQQQQHYAHQQRHPQQQHHQQQQRSAQQHQGYPPHQPQPSHSQQHHGHHQQLPPHQRMDQCLQPNPQSPQEHQQFEEQLY